MNVTEEMRDLMNGLDVEVSNLDENVCQILIAGHLNLYTASDLRREFEKKTGITTKLFIMQISGLQSIDSAGIGAFLSILRVVRSRDGKLVLVQTPAHIKKLFQITRVSEFFKLVESTEEALAILT